MIVCGCVCGCGCVHTHERIAMEIIYLSGIFPDFFFIFDLYNFDRSNEDNDACRAVHIAHDLKLFFFSLISFGNCSKMEKKWKEKHARNAQ